MSPESLSLLAIRAEAIPGQQRSTRSNADPSRTGWNTGTTDHAHRPLTRATQQDCHPEFLRPKGCSPFDHLDSSVAARQNGLDNRTAPPRQRYVPAPPKPRLNARPEAANTMLTPGA